MFCNHCGKPNPDGSKFCSSCGQPISSASAAQPAPRPAAPTATVSTQPAYTLASFDKRFRIAWREFASSPFSLILLIFHSVCTVLTIFVVSDAFEELESAFEILEMLESDVGSGGSFLLTLIQILLCAPAVLISVGMWMMYVDSLDQSDRILNTKGLSVIYWVQIGSAICSGLTFLLLFVSLVNLSGELNDLKQYYGNYSASISTISNLLTWGYIILFVGIIVAILLFRLVINLINSIRDSADYCDYSIDYVVPMAVVQFISGGLNIISLFTTEVTFIGLLTSTLPILFGIMLIRYKRFMENLYYEKEALKAKERKKATPWA
ncbi:MAG: zinc-ribbon domain-containing protein [Oscillospiraceae bacterium]|nr:zinc-ribbon domain-containing protein [Oscillospiraceae bacterium]